MSMEWVARLIYSFAFEVEVRSSLLDQSSAFAAAAPGGTRLLVPYSALLSSSSLGCSKPLIRGRTLRLRIARGPVKAATMSSA